MAKRSSKRNPSRSVSPVGTAVEDDVKRELRESPAFRAEWERLRPFEEIARLVILRRGKLGFSQEEVARRMGTSASVISRIESGQHATSMRTLKRLAKALELQFVVGFEDSSAKRPRRDLVAV